MMSPTSNWLGESKCVDSPLAESSKYSSRYRYVSMVALLWRLLVGVRTPSVAQAGRPPFNQKDARHAA